MIYLCTRYEYEVCVVARILPSNFTSISTLRANKIQLYEICWARTSIWNAKQQKKHKKIVSVAIWVVHGAAKRERCIGVTISNWTNHDLLVWSANLTEKKYSEVNYDAIIMYNEWMRYTPVFRIYAVIVSFTHCAIITVSWQNVDIVLPNCGAFVQRQVH